MLLFDIIKKNKRIIPNQKAVIFKDEFLTYNELYNISNKLCSLLASLKISKRSKIGILLPNSIDYVKAYFSITKFECVIVPFNPDLTERELRNEIQYCDVEYFFTNEKLKNKIIGLSQIKKILIFNSSKKDDTNKIINICSKKIDVKSPFILSDNNVCEGELALMLHTSGTTSNPKRVMLSHKNLLSNVQSNIKSLKLKNDDTVLISLPIFFGYANTAQFLTHLSLGGKVVLMDNVFMPNHFFKIVEKEKITCFTCVPTMLFMLQSFRNKDKYDISSLRYVCFGGGLMPIERLKSLMKDFPKINFVQTYGQTEASPRTTALLPQDAIRKIGSVGLPIPDVNVKIVDNQDQRVQVNEIGELAIKGDNVMLGYYKNPDETNKVLKKGWLYSGDLAKYDEDGYIYLVGRKKNMIISGGKNIYPEEIEEYIQQYPGVKETKVSSEKDNFLGEIPVLYVVKKKKTHITQEEIFSYCHKGLARYKIPPKIIFCNKLEKTYNKKIKR